MTAARKRSADAPTGKPACFSSMRQYVVWHRQAVRSNPGESEFCTDCTPEFQAQMIGEQRCAHPGTTFREGADGFVDGVRPGCELPTRRKRQQPEQAQSAEQPEQATA